MKSTLVLSVIAGLLVGAVADEIRPAEQIWFDEPATMWEEALPVGSGTLGVMVFGGLEKARYSFNEDTLWTGHPHDYAHKGAVTHLAAIRRLVFEGKQREAEDLAGREFMSVPLRQNAYQAFGDLEVTVPNVGEVSDYRRMLDLRTGTATTSYVSGGTRFERQCFVSAVDQAIVIRFAADMPGRVSLGVSKSSPHKEHKVVARGGQAKACVHGVASGSISSGWTERSRRRG
jgi:alpha-L-fucosidase 2